MRKYIDTTYIPWRLLAILALVGMGITIYYIIKPGYPQPFGLFINLIGMFYSIALGLLCFQGSPSLLRNNPTRQTSQRYCPALLGMAVFSFALSQIVWFIEMQVLHHTLKYPSSPHFTSLVMYLFLICAILSLPAQHLSLTSRLRLLLDSLIIMTALATLCYYYVLAPILVGSQVTVQEKVTAGVFPQTDLVLIFCLLLVALRLGETALRPVLAMLLIAVLCFFITNTTNLYETLSSGYDLVSLGNVLYLLAGILIVGAAQTMSRMLKQGESGQELTPEKIERASSPYPTERWKTMLPSALVLIFGLLIVGIWLKGGGQHFPGQIMIVYVGGFIVLLLMVLRQFLAVYEIGKLQKAVRTRNFSLSLLNVRLEQQAISDPLTGLYNHRALVEKLDEALEHARVTSSTCAIIFMDIDCFKTINDRYGHPVGDVVLRNFGTLVKSGLRTTDWVGRWGGEEFLAILPNSEPLEAFHAAERLRTLIEQRVLAGNGELNVTCSLGVATYPQDATDRKNLIQRADQAMYAAKRLGRNQTRAAHEPLVLALGTLGKQVEMAQETEMLAVVESLSAMLDARDHYTGLHARRVAELSLKLALMLGLKGNEVYLVSLGGLLHDIGKVAVPDAILFKAGKFNLEEGICMAQHPVTGANVLASIPTLQAVAEIVRAHHERMNGSGYPDGLHGEEIPLGARIVAVADSYDAMISTRVYRKGRSSAEAVKELQRNAGSLFDPRVVDALVWLLKARQQLTVEVA